MSRPRNDITIERTAPPVPHQPGKWWRYVVRLKGQIITGYVPGSRTKAEDAARATLARLRLLRGLIAHWQEFSITPRSRRNEIDERRLSHFDLLPR